jgi:hypothetical protein
VMIRRFIKQWLLCAQHNIPLILGVSALCMDVVVRAIGGLCPRTKEIRIELAVFLIGLVFNLYKVKTRFYK